MYTFFRVLRSHVGMLIMDIDSQSHWFDELGHLSDRENTYLMPDIIKFIN